MPSARDPASASDPARNKQFNRFAERAAWCMTVTYDGALIDVEGEHRGRIRVRNGKGRLVLASAEEAARIRGAVLRERFRVLGQIDQILGSWLDATDGGE